MPELPEVQTVVFELNQKLVNKKIKTVEVLTPKIISIGPATVKIFFRNAHTTHCTYPSTRHSALKDYYFAYKYYEI
jgi:formamidopyrimidine-DNA glycosylase